MRGHFNQNFNQNQNNLLSTGLAVILILMLAGPLWAENQTAMCAGQPEVTEKEMALTLALMAEIIEMGNQLNPEDEETIIRSRGMTSERMNCILGKLMAGSDIFGWGAPMAYGVNLSSEELNASKKFKGRTAPLRRYLEETLNIKIEDD